MEPAPRKKPRIFVDMDGTLAVWNNEATLEDIHTKGYYENLNPIISMVNMTKQLIAQGYDVHILSAVLQNDYAQAEKNTWLNYFLPEVDKDHRIFVPYGQVKSAYIPHPLETDILIDDYSQNLHEWHGVGVKPMNGINGTKGTWQGFTIDTRSKAEVLAMTIMGIAQMQSMMHTHQLQASINR